MAAVRGFQDVLNGNLNGAGIVLPDSQAENYAIDDVARNGLLNQQQRLANKQYQAQTAKDFSTNKLAISPTIQYRTELNGLAQKWYDKGVQYRRQNFNPFNPDYSKPDQVKASEEYLNEKRHIEAMADLSKEVDKNYNDNQKQVQEGKLDGWDEYQGALKNTSLQKLYQNGGTSSLPQLYKPVDLGEVDKNYHIVPQEKEIDQEIAPGITNTITHKYVNIPQAAATYESLFNNQPGSTKYWQKKGIGDPKNLFTYNGQNMHRDPSNPEDFGHIDEPGIYHQIVHSYLTDPALIKQLPDEIKKKIVGGYNGNVINPWDSGTFNVRQAAGQVSKTPYSPTTDPEFKSFIDKKFNDQITKERNYQGEILSGVERKLPGVPLGDTSKLNATMANVNMRKESIQQGWQRLGMEGERLGIERNKWQEHLKDQGSREQWIQDIQNMNPDAVRSLNSAIKEVRGRIVPRKGGVDVEIPESVPNTKADGSIDPVNPKKQIMHRYPIDKYTGRAGRITIEQILNKLPTFGKEKGLKTEPYAPSYNNIAGEANNDTADDL